VLDPAVPKAFSQLSPPDCYMEFRYNIQRAMEEALDAFLEIDAEYGRRFGRSYGICEVVRADEGKHAPWRS